jgi:hypothetical protein
VAYTFPRLEFDPVFFPESLRSIPVGIKGIESCTVREYDFVDPITNLNCVPRSWSCGRSRDLGREDTAPLGSETR